MTDELPIVLLHGSATGSYSWAAVRMGVVQGIDYLERNLRRFMRPARRHIAWTCGSAAIASSISRSVWSGSSRRGTTP
jgi:hypothetical protein